MKKRDEITFPWGDRYIEINDNKPLLREAVKKHNKSNRSSGDKCIGHQYYTKSKQMISNHYYLLIMCHYKQPQNVFPI